MTKYLHNIIESAAMVVMARQTKPCDCDKDINQFGLCLSANTDLEIAFAVNESILENNLAKLSNL
jgi:hypothetical protein